MAFSQTLSGSDRGLHICFLGDPSIGQTSLLQHFRGSGGAETGGGSSSSSSMPIHQSYILDQVIDSEPFRVRVTDSEGLSLYDKVRKPILRTAHLVVLCFSTAQSKTLESVKTKWLPLIRSLSFVPDKGDAPFLKPCLLLGLQTDLRSSSGYPVSPEEAAKVAAELEAIGYLECSLSASAPAELESLRGKIMQAAKESYLFRWQQKRVKRSLRGVSDQQVDMEAADVDKYVEEAMTVEEDTDPLTVENIKANLSCLGQTPYMNHAYLQCDICDLGLTSIDAMRGYPNLQYLDISNNQLRSLEPLGELPFLLRLNASRNQLVRTQSFGPPRHLEHADFSYNLISELGDWRTHKMLRELNLRGNFISEIDPIALKKCPRLKMLDLSENHIFKIQNLQHNSQLEALYLAQNQLKTLDGIEPLANLSVLNVRGNFLSRVAEKLKPLQQLRKLCVTENKIKSMEEIENLPRSIADLYVSPCPVSELPFFRLQVIRQLPQLRTLDDQVCTPQEKVKANVVYGEHQEREEATFTSILPREQFDDKRLITQELLEQRELEIFGLVGRTAPEDDVEDTASLDSYDQE